MMVQAYGLGEIFSLVKTIFALRATNSISLCDNEEKSLNPGFGLPVYQVSWQLLLLSSPIKQDSMNSFN